MTCKTFSVDTTLATLLKTTFGQQTNITWDLAAGLRLKVGYVLAWQPGCRKVWNDLILHRAAVQGGKCPYLAAGLTCKVGDVLIWQPGCRVSGKVKKYLNLVVRLTCKVGDTLIWQPGCRVSGKVRNIFIWQPGWHVKWEIPLYDSRVVVYG